MDALLGGLLQLCWHSGEQRLRAPLRIGATLLLASVSLLVVGTAVSLVGRVGGWSSPLGSTLGETVLAAVAVLLLVGIISVVDRRYLRDIGLRPGRQWTVEFGVGLALGGLMAGAVVLVVLLAGAASIEGTLVTREGDLLTDLPLAGGVGLGFVFFLLIATLEEIIFRGYLLVNVAEGVRGLLGDRTAVLAGVAVTAVLFGLAHAFNPAASVVSVLSIGLFGLLLGAGHALTNSLAVPIGLHTAWNFALGPVFGLPVSGLTTGATLLDVVPDGPSVITGGAFGPEGGLVSLWALAVGAALLAVWYRRSTGELAVDERVAQPDLRRSNRC